MDLHAEAGRVARHLRTERLHLRPLARSDLPGLARAVNDEDIARMLTDIPHPFGLQDAEHFFALVVSGRVGAAWVIDDGSGLVGMITISPELGYWLARPHWGKGYMTEAVRAAVAAYFAGTSIEAIPSSYFHDNIQSGIVLRKIGFQQVALHVQACLARRQDVMGFAMGLLRERWRAVASDRPVRVLDIPGADLQIQSVTTRDRADIAALTGVVTDGDWIASAAYRGNPPTAHGFGLTFRNKGALVGLCHLDRFRDSDGDAMTLRLDRRAGGPEWGIGLSAVIEHSASHWGIDRFWADAAANHALQTAGTVPAEFVADTSSPQRPPSEDAILYRRQATSPLENGRGVA